MMHYEFLIFDIELELLHVTLTMIYCIMTHTLMKKKTYKFVTHIAVVLITHIRQLHCILSTKFKTYQYKHAMSYVPTIFQQIRE